MLIGSIIGTGSASDLRKPFPPLALMHEPSISTILIKARPAVTPRSFVGDLSPKTPLILAAPI